MAKTRNLLDNINSSNNNSNKKSHVGRNAGIIAGAVGLAGAGTAGAAIYNHLNSEEVAPQIDKDVDVDFAEPEMEEVEIEQDETAAYTGFHGTANQAEVDPIVEDVNDVALNVEDEPYEAVEIDDVLADELAESHEIEFIGDDDEFVTEIIDIEDDNLMIIDDNIEEVEVNFGEDSTVEDILDNDIDDTTMDVDVDMF